MGKHDGLKLFALRIHNISRSCILICEFKSTSVWGMPTIGIPYTADPMEYLDQLLAQIGHDDKFTTISAVGMFDFMQLDKKNVEQHSVVYDLRYTGKVVPKLTKEKNRCYKTVKWVQKSMLDSLTPINYPLWAYIKAAREEECLR